MSWSCMDLSFIGATLLILAISPGRGRAIGEEIQIVLRAQQFSDFRSKSEGKIFKLDFRFWRYLPSTFQMSSTLNEEGQY